MLAPDICILQVQYDGVVWSNPHGRLIAKTHVFTLEKDEFIVCIRGDFGRIINSIEFETYQFVFLFRGISSHSEMSVTGHRSPKYSNKARVNEDIPNVVDGGKLVYFSGQV